MRFRLETADYQSCIGQVGAHSIRGRVQRNASKFAYLLSFIVDTDPRANPYYEALAILLAVGFLLDDGMRTDMEHLMCARFNFVRLATAGCLALLAILTWPIPTSGSSIVPTNFQEAGQPVVGYQDTFTSTSFNSGWVASLAGSTSTPDPTSGAFTLPGDGTLHMNSANSDPNKLLYNPSGVSYSDGGTTGQPQVILAMIRENTDPTAGGDGFRGGTTGASSLANGQGINLHFRPTGQTDGGASGATSHFNLLNDSLAWGPVVPTAPGGGTQLSFTANTDYWFREVINPNAPAGFNNLANGSNDIFAKIWLADGVTPEPTTFNVAWDQNGRAGLAGLATNSIGGPAAFQVNYVLIQAGGLPTITAVPEPAASLLCGLGAVGLFGSAGRRRWRRSLS